VILGTSTATTSCSRRARFTSPRADQPPKIALNPETCVLTIRVRQTVHVRGGTRRFRRASGTLAGVVRGWAVTARNPDGTCSHNAEPLLEVDEVSARGTLSF
jgi:hypothetical protein